MMDQKQREMRIQEMSQTLETELNPQHAANLGLPSRKPNPFVRSVVEEELTPIERLN